MAEDLFSDYFPDLTELENKIGRKTPESLLMWMRGGADCEDGWRSEVTDGEYHSSDCCDSLSDRINSLKQEMRWLRSADVRILRQLAALHEGIEAMRWLLEEPGPLTSRGSSLTGSLTSLATVDEHGPSMSPCRETPSPTCPQELTEITGENSAGQPSLPQTGFGDSNHKSSFDILSSESSEAAPPSPSSSKFMVSHSTPGNHGETSFSTANSLISAGEATPQPQDSFSVLPHVTKRCGDTIRGVLLRSSRPRGSLKVDTFAPTQEPGESERVHQTRESFTPPQTNTKEKEESAPSKEMLLLGYDAQWSWVESQDDVTFV